MEEYGLLGSAAYANSLKALGQPIRLMLSLEMLGYCDRAPNSQQYPSPALEKLYPNSGDFIALIGNLATVPDLLRLRRHLKRAGSACQCLPVPNRGQLLPATRRSDHASFWDCGYRAAMVTDTAFLRNPHYHQSSDRLETLDLSFMTQVCQGLMTGLVASASVRLR
jgi:Zn-dependent M28 family amino/carboxypeptidase